MRRRGPRAGWTATLPGTTLLGARTSLQHCCSPVLASHISETDERRLATEAFHVLQGVGRFFAEARRSAQVASAAELTMVAARSALWCDPMFALQPPLSACACILLCVLLGREVQGVFPHSQHYPEHSARPGWLAHVSHGCRPGVLTTHAPS